MVKPDDPKSAFGAALSQLRKNRGLSTRAVADLLAEAGVPRSGQAVSQWESGADPGRQVVAALEAILDAPGELLPILGYREESTGRLDALERDIAEVRRLVAAIAARLDAEGFPRA